MTSRIGGIGGEDLSIGGLSGIGAAEGIDESSSSKDGASTAADTSFMVKSDEATMMGTDFSGEEDFDLDENFAESANANGAGFDQSQGGAGQQDAASTMIQKGKIE